ncbi:MAG: monofunctional biosynthetic peptidoglycan transglycosylase, partial [Solimonas sp.]
MRLAGGLAALVLALTVLPVALLRWVPPPTTSYMLQSPTRPVQYRWVPRSRISDAARRAVVAAEDQKFWTHDGFDLDAIEKAREHNQKSKRKRGASTISQQTAKNLFLWSGGGYFRKGIEAGYTLLIEAMWPKERILEVYLNVAEFGPGIYGVEAASQAYFHKPAAKLTAMEAARLAAVLPSPRHWSVAQPGAYVQRRANWIVGQMGYGGSRPGTEPEPEI